MDLEAVQFLNLSPIPELSEMELSTMLEQLSNLSDLNGDLTDRNVEDILREAEDLLDKSSCSLPFDSKTIKHISEKTVTLNQSKIPEEFVESNKNSSAKNSNKSDDSSPEQPSAKIFSPGGSANIIKSTIDSLKEYSSLMEKQINSQSSSPKSKEDIKSSDLTTESSVKNSSPKFKTSQSRCEVKNKIIPETSNQTIKTVNCFERLYQDKPVRQSGKSCGSLKKPKIVPKAVVKKKFAKDLKASSTAVSIRDKIQSKSCVARKTVPDMKPKSKEKVNQRVAQISSIYSSQRFTSSSFSEDEPQKEICITENVALDSSCSKNPKVNEDLILKLLQEMEEIKDQVKKSGMVANAQDSERVLKESLSVIDSLRSEVEFLRQKVSSESSQNEGIKRLEEQFSFLKNKYDQQMGKLEMENLKLREALSNQQKLLTPQITSYTDVATNVDFPVNTMPVFASPSSSGKVLSRSVSQENYKAPHNTPCSFVQSSNDIGSSDLREAFSQTEQDFRNISTQVDDAQIPENDTRALLSTTRRTENKENLKNRKVTKPKPFSDLNLLKQKKVISDHETQLMATLRGLQAELSIKDKETRKLKTEMDLLRSQMRRVTRGKVEIGKRSHAGTQTLGLGPVNQKPYNPEMYEVSGEFEKENEELKLRIKSLEENFELLKEKRIADLQSLHRVHEEEMAKLVSKLETQSALTKHLHSLLVNR